MRKTAEQQYLSLLRDIQQNGEDRGDRTGTGTRSLFGEQMKFDLREGFPLLTSKRVAMGAIAHELIWMLRGDNNLRYLAENNVNIWNEWPFVAYLEKSGQTVPEQGSDEWNERMAAYLEQVKTNDEFAAEHGSLGPVYGYQWRHWHNNEGKEFDQVKKAQDDIRNHGESRRIIVSAWNVGELDAMSESGLPPCHMMYQFYSSSVQDPETGKPYLDMKLYQRSGDMFLGVPFNMAQYALLLSMMAQTTDHTPRFFIHTFGDTHIYKNHFNQVEEQLNRENDLYPAPKLVLNQNVKDIGDFTRDDINVVGYEHHPAIKAPVAI